MVSRSAVELPSAAELARLKLSPEVAWYLVTRSIPLPDCPPLVKTPEAGEVLADVRFDPARVDRVVATFCALQHTKGKWAGRPLRPDPWEVAYILAPIFGWVRWDAEAGDGGRWVRVVREFFVELPRKNGKGLYAGEVILTGQGWRKFADLQPGDRVHAVDGTLTEVVAVSPTRLLDCYRVSFADGQSIVCDADHRWTVFDRYGHDPANWAEFRSKGAWRTIDTPELAATVRCGSRSDTRYSVRMDRVIERPEANLPIDAYLLGAWLGDGTSSTAAVTTADPEIWQAFAQAGFAVRPITGARLGYRINGGLQVALRQLGVLGNKHVPERYLTASATQRLALLQGLMDTDGGVNVGPNTPRVEFCSTNQNLAEAVLFLARSLAWKATIRESRAVLRGRDCGPRWRVAWTAYRERSPFRLIRKTGRLAPTPTSVTRAGTNPIVSVERIPSVPTKCIQVAHPSGQFLAGPGLIPTHNSSIGGGILIYLTCSDGEQGAEVVTGASTKEQAGFVFAPVKTLAEKSPKLKPHVKALSEKIVHPRSGSYLQVISSVADAQHGANLHGWLIDELHVHKTADLVEALETGTGSRDQPLGGSITTADAGKTGTIYDRKRRLVEQLAARVFVHAELYGAVWAAPDEDQYGERPFLEETQRRANPGFGVSPTRAYLRAEAAKARISPADLAKYLRLHLGIRTKQVTRYIRLDAWDASAGLVDEQALAGRSCHGGIDLSAVEDVTALCWTFPDDAGGYDVLWRFWLPEARLPELDKRTAGQASVWVRGGFLRLTPGNVIDPDLIQVQVQADADVFDVQTIGFDRWGAVDLVRRLGDEGLTMVPVGQGYASLSAPLKELLRLVLAGRYRHGGNPVMRWMVDNLAVQMDASGNVKPDKANSHDKIDGVSAAVTALKELLGAQAELEEIDGPLMA